MQRADKRKFHYIYKITRDDGKYYIGMHSTDDLDDDYFGSGKLITRSIKKHGIEKHSKEILEFLDSRGELKIRERVIVNEETIADPMCMNLQLGGFGGLINEKHAEAFHKGGHKAMVKSLSAEQRSARSVKANATRKENGNFQPWWPQAAAEAARFSEKRKATFAERGHMQGEKNSQFGTCWVTDGVKPVKIKKEQLDEYLAKGFKRGRMLDRTLIAVRLIEASRSYEGET